MPRFTQDFWDWIEESVYLQNGILTYDSTIWKSYPKPPDLDFERLLDIASDNICEDGAGEEFINWQSVRREIESVLDKKGL